MSIYDADHLLILEREDEARAVGMGLVWDSVAEQDDSPSKWLLLGIVAALATYMAESGIQLSSQTPTSGENPRSLDVA